MAFETTTTFPQAPRKPAGPLLDKERARHADLVGSFALNDANLNASHTQTPLVRKPRPTGTQASTPGETWFWGPEQGIGARVEAVTGGEERLRSERGMTEHMHVLARLHPAWFSKLDAIEPDLCAREDLEALIETAPTAFLAGFLYGKLTMRVQLDAIAQRGG